MYSTLMMRHCRMEGPTGGILMARPCHVCLQLAPTMSPDSTPTTARFCFMVPRAMNVCVWVMYALGTMDLERMLPCFPSKEVTSVSSGSWKLKGNSCLPAGRTNASPHPAEWEPRVLLPDPRGPDPAPRLRSPRRSALHSGLTCRQQHLPPVQFWVYAVLEPADRDSVQCTLANPSAWSFRESTRVSPDRSTTTRPDTTSPLLNTGGQSSSGESKTTVLFIHFPLGLWSLPSAALFQPEKVGVASTLCKASREQLERLVVPSGRSQLFSAPLWRQSEQLQDNQDVLTPPEQVQQEVMYMYSARPLLETRSSAALQTHRQVRSNAAGPTETSSGTGSAEPLKHELPTPRNTASGSLLHSDEEHAPATPTLTLRRQQTITRMRETRPL
ncbi:hypothetical protein EYF80_048369 [Liparis tanakae]|uniref:Uncharacterized protein n=1 Tax=Liparis tanakae TaxID=230148 RepID=A0A4Z2FL31_9TELE|nr:hypothetical protein EYF80_048369 [Liparis tanakae]